MRYQIQLATSVDVAFLAAVMDEDREQWTGGNEAVPIDRLLQTCACSTQVWAARDSNGTPTALWGVTPVSDDPDVGQEPCFVIGVEGGNGLEVEGGERAAVAGTAVQDRGPAEPSLCPLQGEELEQRPVVVERHTPFDIVVLAHREIRAVGPEAARTIGFNHRWSRRAPRGWPQR